MHSQYSTSILASLLIITISVVGGESAYESLFVIGDSSVDTGNHNPYDPDLYTPWRAPYGITWPGKPSGRYSDGRVFTDFYGPSLNVKDPVPYRVINNSLSSSLDVLQGFGGGINFAFGGSGVFPTFGPKFPNISAQVNQLKQLIAKGVVSTKRMNSSVVLLAVAGNDYLVFLKTHPTNEISLFVPKVVAQIAASLQELYELGFRTLAVTNLQPVGCLPQNTYSSNYTSCNETSNAILSIVHNTLLASSISSLQRKNSNARFITLDFYNAFKAALKGTKLSLRPCCEGIDGANCGDIDSNGKALYTLCPSPEKAFFWDSFHPTDAGRKAISKVLQSNDKILIVLS